MRIFVALCLVILFSINSYCQREELENFKGELDFYLDSLAGKIHGVPITASDRARFSNRVDAAFKMFVLNKNSYDYDKYVAARGDSSTKFLRLDNRILVNLKTFPVNNKTYVVYSYTSRDKNNYFIKENESNNIVYEGNSTAVYIAHLYAIDSTHFLLVEETGDHNTSRRAMVLWRKKVPWIRMKAFEGMAFGQVSEGYFIKKFVKRREKFELECEFEFTMSAPEAINDIAFDPTTKTMSYKQYSDNKRYKQVTAKWENETFVIDDYNVNENLHSNDVGVPE